MNPLPGRSRARGGSILILLLVGVAQPRPAQSVQDRDAIRAQAAASVVDMSGQAGTMPPDSAELEALTRSVASRLRCVVCQGLSVEDSPTELAREMRAVVKEQLASGRSPEEVKAYFVARYGEFVLLEPEPRGFNLIVYLLPVFALAGGALMLLYFLRRWTRAPDPDRDAGASEGPGPAAESASRESHHAGL